MKSMDNYSTLHEGMSIDKVSRGVTISFSAKTIFIVLAFGVYWGFVFTAYWGTSFLSGVSEVPETMLTRIGATLTGQAVTFAFILALWKRFSSKRGLTSMVALAIALCMVGSLPALASQFAIELPRPLIILCIFLYGCGHAFLLCRIGFLFDALIGPTMLPAIAVSAFVSCGVFVTVANLPSLVQTLVLAALPLVCSMFVFAARANGASDPSEFSGCRLAECSNDNARPEFRQLFVQILFYSIAFALAQLLSMSLHEGLQNGTFWINIIVAGFVMLIYSLLVKRYVSPPVFLWYLLPVIALGVLPIAISDPDQRSVCWLIAGFGFTVFDLMSFHSLASFIKFNNLSIVRYFSAGRLANAAGMAIGWIYGLVLLSLCGATSLTIGYSFTGLIVLLIATLCYFNLPSKQRETSGEVSAEETMPADRSSAGNERMHSPERRPWHETVGALSREYELSPREEEVFLLLSHGRTARYISEHLFVSIATAKTHIYRIYQKFDISSQQTLIDIVEQRCRDCMSSTENPHKHATNAERSDTATPVQMLESDTEGNADHTSVNK